MDEADRDEAQARLRARFTEPPTEAMDWARRRLTPEQIAEAAAASAEQDRQHPEEWADWDEERQRRMFDEPE